jgi:PmbA protein
MAGYASTRQYISCSVIAGEGDAMQRDDWYASRRAADELPPPEAVGNYRRRARAGAAGRAQGEDARPGAVRGPLAIGLLGHFVQAASGGSLYRKSSFLLDSLGKQIFSPLINISERPHLPRGDGFGHVRRATASRPGSRSGLERRAEWLFPEHLLGAQAGHADHRQRRRLAQPHHAAGRTRSLADMIGSIKRGLLVTELLGHGVNYVTGDYSRGAAGYWIENGEIAYPVEEITIAGNLKAMLAGIVAVGNDVQVRGTKQTGSIMIDRMTVAGED